LKAFEESLIPMQYKTETLLDNLTQFVRVIEALTPQKKGGIGQTA